MTSLLPAEAFLMASSSMDAVSCDVLMGFSMSLLLLVLVLLLLSSSSDVADVTSDCHELQ